MPGLILENLTNLCKQSPGVVRQEGAFTVVECPAGMRGISPGDNQMLIATDNSVKGCITGIEWHSTNVDIITDNKLTHSGIEVGTNSECENLSVSGFTIFGLRSWKYRFVRWLAKHLA